MTVNYQADRLGRRHRAVHRRHRRLRRHRLRDEADEEIKAAAEEGRAGARPDRLRRRSPSPTTSTGVEKGLKLDGATIADIFLGKIKKWNDPAIAKLNPGVKLPDTNITVVHRSDESGTTKPSRRFLADYSPEWKSEARRRQDGQVADRHRRQGQRRRRRRVKQTDGRGRLRRAGLRAAEQLHDRRREEQGRASSSRRRSTSTSAAGEGLKVPADLRFSAINAPEPEGLPDRLGDVPARLPGHVQGRASSKARPSASKNWLDYALGDGQSVAPQLQYAPLPDAIQTKAQAKVDGLSATASR